MSALPPARLWRLAAAWVIDRLLGLLAWSLCAMWLVLGLWGLRGWPRDLLELFFFWLALGALGLALHLVYHVVFVGGCGQTPGRMALGIAVVRRDGRQPGYGRAALRCLGGALDVLTLGLVSLLLVWTRERRGLPDWLAGTRVVRIEARN